MQKSCFAGFHTQHDVIQHREALHQLKVLVDHADAKVVCIVGVIDLDFLAVFLDDALFRLVQAEQNAHEGGFAGAVFAQQGMHFAFAQLEGDVVVCLDTGELLGNIQHFNDKIFSQSAHAPFTNQSIGAALPPR